MIPKPKRLQLDATTAAVRVTGWMQPEGGKRGDLMGVGDRG
jgi:hypothetical protein